MWATLTCPSTHRCAKRQKVHAEWSVGIFQVLFQLLQVTDLAGQFMKTRIFPEPQCITSTQGSKQQLSSENVNHLQMVIFERKVGLHTNSCFDPNFWAALRTTIELANQTISSGDYIATSIFIDQLISWLAIRSPQ